MQMQNFSKKSSNVQALKLTLWLYMLEFNYISAMWTKTILLWDKNIEEYRKEGRLMIHGIRTRSENKLYC